MPLEQPSVIANAIMAHLYDILTNGDDTVPMSEDNFFSWCTPGIPIREEDYDFLTQGLTGVLRKEAVDMALHASGGDGSTEGEDKTKLTPEQINALLGADTSRLYAQTESFARMVDFVPDMASAVNNQFARLSIMNNEGSLSERYAQILNHESQVMKSELPEETKKKIQRFRELLTVKKIKKNLIDDTEIEVSEPSPLVQAYNEKMKAYEDAALEYNSHRIDALAADNPKAVHFWAINANILRNRVKAAMDDWVTNGYKNDYEQIAAFIDQVMLRDMTLLKEEYRDDLAKAMLTGKDTGSDFYYTTLVPGNFVQASGWTEFGFGSAEFNRHKNSKYDYSSSVISSGGGFLGIVGGSGSSSSSQSHWESHVQVDTDYFRLSFKIAQVPIVRPWFKTSFLTSKTWRFDQSSPATKDKMVSNPADQSKAMLPAYPTSMICIKDLAINFTNSHGYKDLTGDYERSSGGGGGHLSLFGFHAGASYSSQSGSGSSTTDYGYHWEGQTMYVHGLQIIGFKCHVLPKSPDPLPNITDWV